MVTRARRTAATVALVGVAIAGCGASGDGVTDVPVAASSPPSEASDAPTDRRTESTTAAASSDAPTGDPRGVDVEPLGLAFAPPEGGTYVNPGAVTVTTDGLVHVMRNAFAIFGGESSIDLFSSGDGGQTWEQVAPVFGTVDVPWTDEQIGAWSLVAVDDGWVLYFDEAAGASGPGSIGRATAPALEGPWSVGDGPVVDVGVEGSWRSEKVAEPSVLRTADGGWEMWFTGVGPTLDRSIGHATSTDGVAWTVDEDPVFTGGQQWDTGTVGAARVVRSGDELVMVYDHARRGAGQLGIAFSDDGLTWTPSASNPIVEHDELAPGSMFQTGLAAVDDGLLLLQEIGVGSQGTSVYGARITFDGAG